MENEQSLKKSRANRRSIKSQLTIFKKFLSKLQSNATGADSDEFHSRFNRFENLISEFNIIQNEIDSLVDEAHLDAEFLERENFENDFYSILSIAKKFITTLNDKNNSDTNSPSNHSTNTDNHINSDSNTQNDPSGIKLPLINLPTFSGESRDWLQFQDAFEGLIINNSKIANVQKFYYLKSSLHGEALESIANLQITNQNFTIAWDTLKDQYTDKRLLLHEHVKALFTIDSVKKESSKALKHIVDHFRMNLRSLKSLGEPTEHWDSLLIFFITSKLDSVTTREWETKPFTDKLPTLEDLLSFLMCKAKMLKKIEEKHSESSQVHSVKASPNVNSYNKNKSQQKTFYSSVRACQLCNSTNHKLFSCAQFIKMQTPERMAFVKRHKLCINCLNPGHQVDQCRLSNCKSCSAKHNTLLHEINQSTSNIQQNSSITLSSLNTTAQQILLSTVMLEVVDTSGNLHECRALLDSGSQSNFLTHSFCKKLGLKTQSVNISVSGITKVESNIKQQCKIKIHSKHNTFSSSLSCLIVPNICGTLPERRFDTSTLHIPPNIRLADPDYHTPKPIDLLIGADLFWSILCIGQIKLGPSLPILHKTKFGWILSGPIGNQSYSKHSHISCNFSQNVDIQNQLSRFWEIENCSTERSYSLEEKACENHFATTHTRSSDGRFIVSIPFKEPISKLGDSKEQATKRFYNLERKLQRNLPLRELYTQFMSEYESLGHMSKVKHSDSEHIQYFLPHHGVLKEDSLSTKLRVVFDGSFPSSTGFSVNDLQMVGPTIQNDLFHILLRFREHQYVVSADICKMYRQVLIEPSQRCLQQILWRADPTEPLNTYQLNTVTYGTSAASFLAIRPLFQLASENKDSYPIASTIIENDFYVDDLLTGSDSLEELSVHCKQVSDILKQGCFDLRKWISNESQVLVHVQDSSSDLNTLQLGSNDKSKTLGLLWCSQTDHLTYNINSITHSTHVTKRIILSSIAQIFDPLGLLSPCTIMSKMLLQKLWLEKVSWDESVPADIHTKWLRFQNDLISLNECRVPRHVKCQFPVHLQVHIFSDSSEGAYGACAYIRSIHNSGQISVHLLCSKTKVAPLHTISLPRLELCGALIAARLSHIIQSASHSTFHDIFHWTDSTIVLGWINTHSHLLKTFVANRVSEIQTKTQAKSWHHVSSKDNPADLLSRGANPNALITSQFWWHGPSWLSLPQHNWPISHSEIDKDLPELKSTTQSLTSVENTSCFIPIEKFSNLNKLKRIAAYCIRFTNNCTPQKAKLLGPLTASEIDSGLTLLVKLVQREYFSLEITHLSKNKQIPRRSKIHTLAPFIDQGILRVGGRLKFSHLDFNMQHPILLPPKHHLTKLIFYDTHIKLFHTGPSHLLATTREKFWAISGRNTARNTVHNCITCSRAKPKFAPPLMGELPQERVTPSYPFQISGVDYAGPFILKDRLGRGCKTYKAWVCLFICLTTKCMHLEIATDLSKDSFIACLRRFIARRGKPIKLISDNGTNFVGAKSEIDQIANFLKGSTDSFQSFCANEGIQWKFIPAYSPHFGGLWEAGVKSLKFHLKRVVCNTLLVYEDFQTILVQIESILNSRPLYPSSSDPNDLTPITPAHFIIGRSFSTLPDPNFNDVPVNRLSRFQHIQSLQQHIWKRWSKDYLTELQHRQKWFTNQPNIQLGTLVTIKDITPPLQWKMGRVTALHPGQDGVVRTVTLKTSRGEVRRAVANLCPLPVPY